MRPNPNELQGVLPLTPLDYHVLLVLADRDLYGYALKKAVARESEGAVSPEIGSLYRVLARLLDSGMVAEAEPPEGAPASHRGRDRRYYGLTPLGRRALQAESARLRRALELAAERDLLAETGSS